MSELTVLSFWARREQPGRLPGWWVKPLWSLASGRSCEAVLTLVSGHARLTIRVNELGLPPVVGLSVGADGISDIDRAKTWADWSINDFDEQCVRDLEEVA